MTLPGNTTVCVFQPHPVINSRKIQGILVYSYVLGHSLTAGLPVTGNLCGLIPDTVLKEHGQELPTDIHVKTTSFLTTSPSYQNLNYLILQWLFSSGYSLLKLNKVCLGYNPF